jgi:hypothetical protein
MDTQETMRRIIEFMNIPDFELIMSAKLLELEMALRPQIKHFQDLKSRFKKMAHNEMKLLKQEDREAAPGETVEPAYYFELKQTGDRQPWWRPNWVVWDIRPEPVDSIPHTVLKKLGQSMSTYDIDPARIVHSEILSSDLGVYFDINFTRYSEAYAFGVLRQSSKKDENTGFPEQMKMLKLNMGYRKCKKEDSYGELLRYLESYPEIRERLLAYFYMMEKPRADKAIKSA